MDKIYKKFISCRLQPDRKVSVYYVFIFILYIVDVNCLESGCSICSPGHELLGVQNVMQKSGTQTFGTRHRLVLQMVLHKLFSLYNIVDI